MPPRIIGAMTRRISSPTLVGREQALGRLLEAVAGARAGEPRHVVVGGEAGVGKTRLLSRARELVEGEGGRVVSGGCIEMGNAALPFAPYAEIVRTLVADEGAASRHEPRTVVRSLP